MDNLNLCNVRLFQCIYYPTIISAMSGAWMSDFAGYVTPSQIIWGIIFGWLVDRVGTLPLCYAMNTLVSLDMKSIFLTLSSFRMSLYFHSFLSAIILYNI